MRQREKDLKKKLKKQREKEKSTASSTNNDVINNNDVTDAKSDVIDGNNDEIDDDRTKPPSDRNSDSSDVENDLPDTYIEEIVTERQFIDSDGQVQTEVTTVEVTFDLFSLKTVGYFQNRSLQKIKIWNLENHLKLHGGKYTEKFK